VPIVLAVLAAGFGYEAVQDRSAMTSIPVAASAIPAGSAVDAADTRLVQVHASDAVLANGLLGVSQLGEGWTAAVAVAPGQPIALSELTKPDASGEQGAMSIEVPVDHAAGGSIVPGDLVDVIAANGSGGAYYVAQGLRVLSVAPSGSGGGVLGGGTGDYFVVVAVGKRTALKISAALGASASSGTGIEVVRSTGEVPTGQLSYQAAATGTGSGG
jgi:Flp pilus assembly protein CpaB